MLARPPQGHLPADQDVERVARPGARRQAGPDRGGAGALLGPVVAFDEFGPLGIRPTAGSCWAEQGRPERHPATYHGVRYFHGCYSVGDDTWWGVNRRKKGAANTLAALRSIRAARPDGAPIYVILDNLSAHKGDPIRRWAKSRRTSGRCGSSPSPTPTTATTPRRPAPCMRTCAGATPTPAIPTSSPPPAPRTRPHPQREGHPLGRTPPRHRGLKNPAKLIRSQN